MNSLNYALEEDIRDAAVQLYPTQATFSKKQIAKILGVSESYIYHDKRFSRKRYSVREIARIWDRPRYR